MTNTKEPKKSSIKRKYLMTPSFIPRKDLITYKEKIRTKHISELLLWVLTSTSPTSGPVSPRWLNIVNHYKMERFVVLFVPGLGRDKFGLSGLMSFSPVPFEPISQLSFFDKFDYAYPTEAPGSKDRIYSVIDHFKTIETSKSQSKRARKAAHDSPQIDKISLNDLLLSEWDLIRHRYPLDPKLIDCDGIYSDNWTSTKDLRKSEPELYAIDCEMCRADSGQVLTRATILNQEGSVIYDKLVKPSETIIDYATQFSGITAEKLENVTTTLSDVQNDILALVSNDDILAGHSLENDLDALKIRHTKIIDTALIYDHPRNDYYKPSLRWLTERYLKRAIQTGGAQGHDSTEDALACLDLIRVKLTNGANFGKRIRRGENLVEVLYRAQPSRTTAIVDHESPRWDEGYAQTVISCADDDEVIDHLIKQIPKHNFNWGGLHELEKGLGWVPVGRDDHGNEIRADPTDDEKKIFYEKLDSRLHKLYNSLPENTALILMTGHGDPRLMQNMQRRRKAFTKEFKERDEAEVTTTWTQDDELILLSVIENTRSGLTFLTVKTESTEDSTKRSRSSTPDISI